MRRLIQRVKQHQSCQRPRAPPELCRQSQPQAIVDGGLVSSVAVDQCRMGNLGEEVRVFPRKGNEVSVLFRQFRDHMDPPPRNRFFQPSVRPVASLRRQGHILERGRAIFERAFVRMRRRSPTRFSLLRRVAWRARLLDSLLAHKHGAPNSKH